MRDLLEITCRVEARGELVGERLIVDKAVRLGGTNGSFVETLGIELAIFDARDLGPHQGGPILEILRTIFRPYFELSVVGHQSIKMLLVRPAQPDFRLCRG